MKGQKMRVHRWIALFLCIVMCAALLPVDVAYAADLSTPVLKSASISGNAILVTWNAVSGAEKYRVFRKGPGDSSWKIAGDSGSTSYTDYDVKNNSKYSYTVRCIAADLSHYTSSFDNTGVSCTYFLNTTPVLSSAELTSNGIKVTWSAVSGAAKYRVFRKAGSGSWAKLIDTAETSYTDTSCSAGTTYTYTVRCLASNGSLTSDFDAKGVSCTYYSLATPSMTSAVPASNGITVTWSAVSGAAKYRLYRKTATTKYVKVIDTTATSYTDTACSAGVAYKYTVVCLDSKGNVASGYDAAGKTATFFTKVAVTSLNCISGGITVSWNSVSAPYYQLYRKANSGSWISIAKTSSASYTDNDVVSGNTYTYCVKALDTDQSTVVGTFDSTGKSTQYFDTPELIHPATVNGKNITINWIAVQGVSKYAVYRKTAGGSWLYLADTSSTTYTDTKAASGVVYYYTVRCRSNTSSAYVSGFDPVGVSTTGYVGTPKMTKAEAITTGIKITWERVGSYTDYQIYRRTQNSSWQPLTTATVSGGSESGSYTDPVSNVISGTLYYYSVAVMKDGSVISDKDPAGVFATFYKAPVLYNPSYVKEGIKISWQAVDNVPKYRVFRKEASGTSWSILGDTTNTYYIDKTAISAGTYIYTVRNLSSSGAYLGGYDTVGKKITYYSTPVVTSATVVGGNPAGSTGTVKIVWQPVDGTNYFNVYRKTGTGSWAKIAKAVKGTSYTDTPPSSGVKYAYTVRSATSTGVDSSYWDNTGKEVTFYQVPKHISVSAESGSITFKWGSVNGAAGYKVYRKLPGGSWTLVKTVDKNTLSYKDTSNLISGQQYIYTVRAYNGSVMGGWDSVGLTATAK